MDTHTPEQRSRNMSRIKSRDTSPEIRLRKALWASGLRYRVHYPLPGRPDVAFISAKLAVFVDGCFWHRCPIHGTNPKSNAAYWQKKLANNVKRDKAVNLELESLGWEVVRIWEHEINENIEQVTERIQRRLSGH